MAQLSEKVLLAKAAYADVRKELAEKIQNNQKAMHAFRAKPSQENKVAYENTRKAHKLCIEKIKKVRQEFYILVDADFDEQASIAKKM